MSNILSILAFAFSCCIALPILWVSFVDFIWRIRALFGCGHYADD